MKMSSLVILFYTSVFFTFVSFVCCLSTVQFYSEYSLHIRFSVEWFYMYWTLTFILFFITWIKFLNYTPPSDDGGSCFIDLYFQRMFTCHRPLCYGQKYSRCFFLYICICAYFFNSRSLQKYIQIWVI